MLTEAPSASLSVSLAPKVALAPAPPAAPGAPWKRLRTRGPAGAGGSPTAPENGLRAGAASGCPPAHGLVPGPGGPVGDTPGASLHAEACLPLSRGPGLDSLAAEHSARPRSRPLVRLPPPAPEVCQCLRSPPRPGGPCHLLQQHLHGGSQPRPLRPPPAGLVAPTRWPISLLLEAVPPLGPTRRLPRPAAASAPAAHSGRVLTSLSLLHRLHRAARWPSETA